jgi:cytochrome c oxidase subunit 2
MPDTPAATTVTGDAERGARLYQTCGLCHGGSGEGNWAMNAPRLAGMSDWYLKRQLINFRQEDSAARRGGHPDDIYGDQMNLVGVMLKTDSAIDDVVAYINTLP